MWKWEETSPTPSIQVQDSRELTSMSMSKSPTAVQHLSSFFTDFVSSSPSCYLLEYFIIFLDIIVLICGYKYKSKLVDTTNIGSLDNLNGFICSFTSMDEMKPFGWSRLPMVRPPWPVIWWLGSAMVVDLYRCVCCGGQHLWLPMWIVVWYGWLPIPTYRRKGDGEGCQTAVLLLFPPNQCRTKICHSWKLVTFSRSNLIIIWSYGVSFRSFLSGNFDF